MRQLIITAILVLLAFAAMVLAVVLWPNEGAESRTGLTPVEISAVIEDLAPGDTLHIVTATDRQGVESDGACQVGRSRHETWTSYDAAGEMVDSYGEVRAEDGTLCGTAAMEGDDLVFRDAAGEEQHLEIDFRSGKTVQATKDSIAAVVDPVSMAESLNENLQFQVFEVLESGP